MSRRPILSALAALATTLAAAPALRAQITIPLAVVDSRRVLQAAPGLAEADQQLQRDVAVIQQATQNYADSIRAMAAPMDQQSRTAAPAKRAEIANVLRLLEAGVSRRVEVADSTAAARRQAVLAPFLALVHQAIEEERAAMHVGMVFRVDASGTLLSSAPAIDITDRVLTRIRGLRPPGL